MLLRPLLLFAVGAGFIGLLVVLHEPAYPTASLLFSLDVSHIQPQTKFAGCMPSVDRSLLLWSLVKKDSLLRPWSRLVTQRLLLADVIRNASALAAAASAAAAASLFALPDTRPPPVYRLDARNVHVLVNETFVNSKAKYILTDDAGAKLPVITVLTEKIVEEELMFDANIYAFETPSAKGRGSYLSIRTVIPGSLQFSRLSFGLPATFVYSRKGDERLFRLLIDLEPQARNLLLPGAEFPSVARKSIAGPLYDTSPGSIMNIKTLFSPNREEATVFVFQYRDIPERDRAHISISIFNANLEELESLHFLTDPVVTTSGLTKSLAFVFLKSIFTLDYVGPSTSGTTASQHEAFGYVLSRQPIPDLSGSDFRISHMHIDSRGTTLIASTKPPRSSNPVIQALTVVASSIHRLISSLDVLSLAFNLLMEATDVTDSMATDSRDATPRSSLVYSEWSLASFWSTADHTQFASPIVSLSLLEDDRQDLVAILLKNMHIVIVDHINLFQGSHALLFVRRHMLLVFALSVVTVMFSINEFRPA
ncbi:hypothetical protein HK105_200652 [Polyrhizophydium stewartii]|uniref:Uncharacterized protein n=1 Tax=Polyrhizophydium stewartii TaxID=2732419 RepID=A0ABR4NJQ1_9FUNG